MNFDHLIQELARNARHHETKSRHYSGALAREAAAVITRLMAEVAALKAAANLDTEGR